MKMGRLENVIVTAGSRCFVEVELDREFRGAVKVVANAI